MIQWMKKHMILMWAMGSILYAFIIHCLFSVYPQNPWFIAKWSAGDILTYVSTVSLGLLAVWQNKKIQSDNDIAQERLENIIKHSNEIEIINKIVEYEIENLRELKNAFDDFSCACDPQIIASYYANNSGEVIRIKSAMVTAEQNLDSCFFKLARELRLDMKLKQNDETPIKKPFATYYRVGKELISKLQEDPLQPFENQMVQLAIARDAFVKEREQYLVEREEKLNTLLYGNLGIDDIKELYKRD